MYHIVSRFLISKVQLHGAGRFFPLACPFKRARAAVIAPDAARNAVGGAVPALLVHQQRIARQGPVVKLERVVPVPQGLPLATEHGIQQVLLRVMVFGESFVLHQQCEGRPPRLKHKDSGIEVREVGAVPSELRAVVLHCAQHPRGRRPGGTNRGGTVRNTAFEFRTAGAVAKVTGIKHGGEVALQHHVAVDVQYLVILRHVPEQQLGQQRLPCMVFAREKKSTGCIIRTRL